MPEPTSPMPDQMYPKTHAKDLYCLTEKDLEPLVPKEKTNPYVRKGTPMKLYKQRDVSHSTARDFGRQASHVKHTYLLSIRRLEYCCLHPEILERKS